MSSEQAAGKLPGEPDRPHTTFIFLFVLVSLGTLAGVVVGIDQFFNQSMREEIQDKILGVENPVLRQLRADEEARLSRYQWVDAKKQVVRVPLDRARELVLAEWASRPGGYSPGTPEGPPPTPPAKPSSPAPAPVNPPPPGTK